MACRAQCFCRSPTLTGKLKGDDAWAMQCQTIDDAHVVGVRKKIQGFDMQALEARSGADEVLEILHRGQALVKAEHEEAREEEGAPRLWHCDPYALFLWEISHCILLRPG
jgi:hypothetical protein